MEISALGNSSTAPKSSVVETDEYYGKDSKQAGTTETKSSVSNESQTSLVPPPSPTSESGNEPATIPTAESNTGGQINVTI